jgi:hypothetical protein
LRVGHCHCQSFDTGSTTDENGIGHQGEITIKSQALEWSLANVLIIAEIASNSMLSRPALILP